MEQHNLGQWTCFSQVFIFSFFFHQLLKQKIIKSKKIPERPKLCKVLGFHSSSKCLLPCSVDRQFSTLDVEMRNMIENIRRPIKCKRTASMALKWTASHDYVLQFIFINEFLRFFKILLLKLTFERIFRIHLL